MGHLDIPYGWRRARGLHEWVNAMGVGICQRLKVRSCVMGLTRRLVLFCLVFGTHLVCYTFSVQLASICSILTNY